MKTRAIFLFCCLAAALLSGCGDNDVERHPLYLKAMRERAEGHYQEAERTLKRLVAKRPDAAKLHMALASLYDEHLGDPLGALYHYREAERLGGGAVDAATLQAWMTAARERYAETLGTIRSKADFEALERANAELQNTVIQLRTQIADAVRPEPAAEVAPAPEPPPAPDPPPRRIHRVAAGDTLGALARRYYGSASQYRRIMEANQLTERSILKIGQELIIPDRNPENRP